MKDIKEILQSISNDILTEEVKGSIVTTFNEAVDTKVSERVLLEVKNELTKMDEDHSIKLKKLVESIDEDHTAKFKRVVESIDKNHTAKLNKIIEKYDKELNEKAVELREELTNKLSKYLDLYLEKAIPLDQLKESVENIRAKKIVDEVKKLVALDEEFVDANFKLALKDGHDTIENLKEQVNTKTKEALEINQKLLKTQSELILEKKTINLPKNKKDYVYKLLEGKNPTEIESNFNYVIDMFEKDESDKKSLLVESAKENSTVLSKKVDTSKNIIEENIQPKSNLTEDAPEASVNGYLDSLKDLDRK